MITVSFDDEMIEEQFRDFPDKMICMDGIIRTIPGKPHPWRESIRKAAKEFAMHKEQKWIEENTKQ